MSSLHPKSNCQNINTTTLLSRAWLCSLKIEPILNTEQLKPTWSKRDRTGFQLGKKSHYVSFEFHHRTYSTQTTVYALEEILLLEEPAHISQHPHAHNQRWIAQPMAICILWRYSMWLLEFHLLWLWQQIQEMKWCRGKKQCHIKATFPLVQERGNYH